MKEAISLVLGLLLAVSAADPSGPTSRRSSGPWKQQPQAQSRVYAHSGLTIVSPPQLAPSPRFSRRGGPLPGYLPLRPVSAPRHPRWFAAETAPKASYIRPPPSYERYPPFWSDEGSKHSRNRRPQSSHRHAKKDCNPCNSVPWTPIFKSPAGLSSDHHPRELVPHIDVYPEQSIQQTSIVAPQLLTNVLSPPALVGHAQQHVSLPIGNSPVSPDLLLPPQHLVPFPELSPHPVAPIHDSVPFSSKPQASVVAPKESSNVVVTISEPEPPKDVHLVANDQHSDSSSFISSHVPQNNQNYNNFENFNYNHYNNYHPQGGLDIVKSIPLAEYTSSIEYPLHLIQSGPYIDINSNSQPDGFPPSQLPSFAPQPSYGPAISQPSFDHNNQPSFGLNNQPSSGPNNQASFGPNNQASLGPNNQASLGPNYLPSFDPNNQSNTAEFTYEKSPQTGSQKVSDFILGVGKDNEKSNLLDSYPSSSDKVSAQPAAPAPAPTASAQATTPAKGKATRYQDSYKGVLDPNILTPPPLPPHLTQLLPTYETAYLHPLFPVENQGVASVVNGALLPPPVPQPMNPTTLQPSDPTIPPKKIQIIIPYTTVNNHEVDQNALGSAVQLVNHSSRGQERLTWPPIVVTESPQNQPRKVPATQNFYNFKNYNWSEGQSSESSQVQHILAANIRDLLKKEMEPKQNIRLQKNIDNWTALEYSNHKTVGKKQPGDVISHAHAVTSIPGTSISHLLLPSKKIPNGYLTTPVGPDYDEPATTPFPASSVSVNSQPFTTVSRYSSVAWTRPTTRATTRGTKRFSTTTPSAVNENEIPEETTPGQRWSDLRVSIAPGTNEKVYVVTPESNWATSRRSTRHIEVTEKYTPEASQNTLFTKLEKVNETPTAAPVEKSKVKQKPLYPKSTPLFRVKANQTRYEKVSKFNKPKPIDKFFATTTKPLVSFEVTTPKAPVTTTEVTSTTAAIFPFRNGGELPLEMAQVNFSSSQLTFKNTGDRKTLIKQIKTNNRRGKQDSETSTATTGSGRSSTEAGMEVDVVLPVKANAIKKGELKKPTTYGKKKTAEKSVEKTDEKVINPDEPNITEDDREEINSLMKKQAGKDDNDTETLLAVETAVPPSMPGGVFGETRPGNSSRSLLDTIKLLRDFLADTSEEQSQEKTIQLGKVLEKIDASEKTLKNKEAYKYNFPEYLVGELNLSKDEMGLVQDAMVELQKNKERKKIEQ